MNLVTRIDRVTLFRNGALIVRTGTLPASTPAGETLRIPGMPLLYSSESLRVRLLGEGVGPVSLGPIEEEPELGDTPEQKSLDELRERELRQRRRVCEEDIAEWTRLADFHSRMCLPEDLDLAPEAPASLPDLSVFSALTDFGAAARERAVLQISELQEQIRKIELDLKRLDRARQTARADEDSIPAHYTRCLRAELRGSLLADVIVEVEYFIAGARWTPSYELVVNEQQGQTELQLLAMVAQATGEPWEQVAVSFSTADLRRDTRLGKLSSWRIGRAAPPPPPAWRPLPEDLQSLFAGLDTVLSERSQPSPKKSGAVAKRESRRQAREEEASPLDMEICEDLVATPCCEGAPPPPAPCAAPSRAPGKAKDQARPRPSPPPQSLASGGAMSSPRMASDDSFVQAKSAAPFSFGARSDRPEAPAEAEEESLDIGACCEPSITNPSLDHAWLRLPSYEDRTRRGRLLPVSLSSDLRALIEERGGDPSGYETLERSLDDLRRRQRELYTSPLPVGCQNLDSCSFAFRYPSGPRVTIPSDGRFHQVSIRRAEAPYRTVYRVVPRQDTKVHRTVLLDNPLKAPLAAGPMRIHVDGAFVATGQIPSLGSGAVLRLGLGIEEGIRVARNPSFVEQEKGLLSSSLLLDHTIRTELRSRLQKPVRVEIFERLPLAAGSSEIEVKLENAVPSPERDRGPNDNKVEGALKWSLDLPPDRPVETSWRYTIRIPTRKEIVGGNRRES